MSRADGNYHYVYRTGDHDPLNQKPDTLDPVFHSSCNRCLTDLDAPSAEKLAELLQQHADKHEGKPLPVEEKPKRRRSPSDQLREIRRLDTGNHS